MEQKQQEQAQSRSAKRGISRRTLAAVTLVWAVVTMNFAVASATGDAELFEWATTGIWFLATMFWFVQWRKAAEPEPEAELPNR